MTPGGVLPHKKLMKPSCLNQSVNNRRSLDHLLLPWLAVIAWAALIFYFSAQPSLTTHWGLWDFIFRKLAHMFEFGVLSFLVWRALRQHRLPGGWAFPAAAALSLMYAVSDEIHQSYVPGRTAAVRDVWFDIAGIAAVVVAVLVFRRRRA